MKRFIPIIAICIFFLIGLFVFYAIQQEMFSESEDEARTPTPASTQQPTYPLSIAAMQSRKYPGSALSIDQTLDPGSNYRRYIVSYRSDGLKIYALLTVPDGDKPAGGWPVVIFNHGYIPPEIYRTTERYIAYVDAIARNGYIVLKPDYRGNGSSEGSPEGAYYSPAYTVDVLNAVASMKQYPDANKNKIGMWGHSMGGNITLRALVIDPQDIKAAVIWGGVIGTYDQLMNHWTRVVAYRPSQRELTLRNNNRSTLIKQFGTPQTNPSFWNSIDPDSYLSDIQTPLQLHHGQSDEEVPVAFSQTVYDRLTALHKTVSLYTYPGADHNISDPSFTTAMNRSIDFFNQYLKSKP